jgi:hypothetical protein
MSLEDIDTEELCHIGNPNEECPEVAAYFERRLQDFENDQVASARRAEEQYLAHLTSLIAVEHQIEACWLIRTDEVTRQVNECWNAYDAVQGVVPLKLAQAAARREIESYIEWRNGTPDLAPETPVSEIISSIVVHKTAAPTTSPDIDLSAAKPLPRRRLKFRFMGLLAKLCDDYVSERKRKPSLMARKYTPEEYIQLRAGRLPMADRRFIKLNRRDRARVKAIKTGHRPLRVTRRNRRITSFA